MVGWFNSFNSDTSLIAVLGIPSSLDSLIFLRAKIYPVILSHLTFQVYVKVNYFYSAESSTEEKACYCAKAAFANTLPTSILRPWGTRAHVLSTCETWSLLGNPEFLQNCKTKKLSMLPADIGIINPWFRFSWNIN